MSPKEMFITTEGTSTEVTSTRQTLSTEGTSTQQMLSTERISIVPTSSSKDSMLKEEDLSLFSVSLLSSSFDIDSISIESFLSPSFSSKLRFLHPFHRHYNVQFLVCSSLSLVDLFGNLSSRCSSFDSCSFSVKHFLWAFMNWNRTWREMFLRFFRQQRNRSSFESLHRESRLILFFWEHRWSLRDLIKIFNWIQRIILSISMRRNSTPR